MCKIKIITKGGLITKKAPVTVPEKYFGLFSKDISMLETYEDLCRYKKKQQLANYLWNIGFCFCVAKTKGAFWGDSIAFVACDEHEDFPVWIIICNNYNNHHNQIHYKYYDATSQKRKADFSWALPAIQTEKQFRKFLNNLSEEVDRLNLQTLRDEARKQGLFILNSPNHITGGYMIVNENNIIQAGEQQGLSFEEVEKYFDE